MVTATTTHLRACDMYEDEEFEDGDTEPEVYQGVRIFTIQVEDDNLVVDVFGGKECMVGSLVYVIPDPDRRLKVLATLTNWWQHDKEITYVRTSEGVGRLMSEVEYLREVLASGD
jgi:hypothetical protein